MFKEERDIRSLLLWLIVLRVVVVATLLGTATLMQVVIFKFEQTASLFLNPLYNLIALTFFLTFIYVVVYKYSKRIILLAYIQLVGDVFVESALIYLFGGLYSPGVQILYLVTIIVASILLFRKGGFIIASICFIMYGLMVNLIHYGIIPPPTTFERQYAAIALKDIYYYLFIHMFAFFTTAYLTGFLSEKIHSTRLKLEEKSDELEDLQIFHSDVISSMGSGLLTFNLDGKITFYNKLGADYLNLSSFHSANRPVQELIGETDGFLERMSRELEESRSVRIEKTFEREGARKHYGMGLSHLRDKDGTVLGYILIIDDLTEFKELEEEVRYKDRMATIGEMAAGIAHEIRNPLASISGSVQVLEKSSDAGEEEKNLLSIINRESRRLADIISEFLNFARPRRTEKKRVDLVDIVNETLSLFEHSSEVDEEHSFSVEGLKTLHVEGDQDQLKQVVWNLAKNAVKAMPRGGKLIISISMSNGRAVLIFKDEGIGISEEERDKIMKPFHGKFQDGLGLGLAIVHRIVKEHKGDIEVESEKMKGTTVRVRFPL